MTLELLMQDKYRNGLEQGLAKGLAQGKAQAEAKAKEEKAQTVRNFYGQGLSVEAIAKDFGLSATEVQSILSTK